VPIFFAIKLLGLLYGTIAVAVVWQCAKLILSAVGVEHFCLEDYVMIYFEDPRHYANITGFVRLEKFEAQSFRDFFFEKWTKFPRVRSKVVRFLGSWWFKELQMQDLIKRKESLIQIKSGLHTE
jgi:hypothetical protein